MGKSIEEAGEIWYQRAKKLAAYAKDTDNDISKRVKAVYLFKIMEARVLRIAGVYTAARIVSQKNTPPPFQKGGIII